jgi:leucyl/phenylalanyl-tRNA--protein transferase
VSRVFDDDDGNVGPAEPPPTRWELPPADVADELGVVGAGADLEPGTLLAAYRAGIFPMPLPSHRMLWWSPDPRGILPLDRLHVSRSLRRSLDRFEIRVDTAFDAVVAGCADPRRPQGWITKRIGAAYGELFRLGWAHSVEAWSRADGLLAGGLYGVATGGLFAGESMFHRERDASKAALVALVELLSQEEGDPSTAAAAGRLLDVQWVSPHLSSLGAVEVPRADYLGCLDRALRLRLPPAFRGARAFPPP